MDESFTIQISHNLVKQLADDGDRLKKKTRKPKAKISRDPPNSQAKIHQKQIPGDSATLKGPAAGWPLQPPLYLPVAPPPQSANSELDEIRSVLRESDKVVERLQKREEEVAKEVTQRAKDLHDKEFQLPYQKPMACLVEKNACLECYREHPNDPLKCANVVNNFADCARRVRQLVSSMH
ncbi:hypothetical protein RJ639_021532 [Escallonia herrerae]|uniref:Uncharacterized protein n=1 Tax=Escallonia herrerae TaxID=1293975 RepID=A0AA88V4E9_9ASTE|nr:hypothetical protein RJ639_021532 [Escallonia herrerae]